MRRSQEVRTARPSVTRGPRIDSRELSDEARLSSEGHYDDDEYEYGRNVAEIDNRFYRKVNSNHDDGMNHSNSGGHRFDDSDTSSQNNSAADMNSMKGHHEHMSRSHDRQRSRPGQDVTGDRNYNSHADEKHRNKREGPDVIVTEVDVHSSTEEHAENKNDYSYNYDRSSHGDDVDIEGHDGEGENINSNHTREVTKGGAINRKYQSHQNLSRCGESEEERKKAKFQRSATHHYTPQLVRKGTEYSYEIPIDDPAENELGDSIGSMNFGFHSNHGNKNRSGSPVQKTSSLADMGQQEFTMPPSKMGSFQDFKPLKHSPSTPRVSSSKGRDFFFENSFKNKLKLFRLLWNI
jgi:hypothetical protein